MFLSFVDVVKLTAQFVARNGRQFLTNLMNREQRNYQFDFLRPQHSLFQYFPLKLVWLLSERLQQVSLSRLMAMNTAVNPPQVRAAGWWCWWQPDSQFVLTGSSSNGTGRIHGVYHILVHSWFHLKQTQQLLRHYRRPTFLPDM